MTHEQDRPAVPEARSSPPLRGRVRARLGRAGPFLAGVVSVFLALAVYGAINPGKPPLTGNDVNQAIASALASQTPGPAVSELVYQAIQPSLVLIETDGAADPSGDATRGLGSGVVVNAAGNVLTALHVVDDAKTIKLTFADGTTSGATVTVREADHDIAVLQPDTLPATLVPATLGNPASMRIGSDAYIVGNPFGLTGSMSAGVVSGLDRSFQSPDHSQLLHGLIQVDAAVNPGNSGGPLLNRGGQVVGIVTALINPTKQDVFIGIGLAVPIDVAGGAAGLPPD